MVLAVRVQNNKVDRTTEIKIDDFYFNKVRYFPLVAVEFQKAPSGPREFIISPLGGSVKTKQKMRQLNFPLPVIPLISLMP